jgi:hypothetical protein
MNKRFIIAAAGAAAAAVLVGATAVYFRSSEPAGQQDVIKNFDDCLRAGNPVMESQPEQCRTADGRLFVKMAPPQPQDRGGQVAAKPPLPADAQQPAAGICADPPDGDIVTVSVNQDVPSPRCQVVRGAQMLEISNNTTETVKLWFGDGDRVEFEIAAGQDYRHGFIFERFLEPGVHFMYGLPYSGTEIVLKKDVGALQYSFDDYVVAGTFTETPAEVDFETYPQAKNFITKITEGAAQGPNFAGRYTVIEWGCGSSCQMHAIVDAGSGAIVGYNLPSAFGLEYRKDSRLLIANPPAAIVPAGSLPPGVSTDYYEMRDGRLEPLGEQSTDQASASGIRGLITIGPVCPVIRLGEEEKCADKPYQTVLDIKDIAGNVVGRVTSGADGRFSIDLPPGDYVISQSEPHPILQRLGSTEVGVEAGSFTEVNLAIDSGIR